MAVKKNRLVSMAFGIGFLLLIPLIAMQFTDEVNWSVNDFLVMGVLLLVLALAIEVVLRSVKKAPKRTVLIIMLIGIFLLVWAELAVGIFGTPFAGN